MKWKYYFNEKENKYIETRHEKMTEFQFRLKSNPHHNDSKST